MKKSIMTAKLMLPLIILAMLLGAFTAQAESVLQTADGWQYRLLSDGRAEILGHADATAAELTVPLAVDGAWVAAIGDNAFAEQPALTAVTIPSSVTAIADSAFGDNASLNLRAFNGTEALRHAAGAGLNAVNLSEYDLFDDIVDLTDMTGGWGLEQEETLVIPAPFDVLVTEGAKLFLPVNPVYPAGFPVRVLSVEAGDGRVVAQVQPLDFVDAVESYYADDVVLTIDPDGFVPGPGVTVLPTLSSEDRAESSVTATLPLGFVFEQKYDNKASIGGSAMLNLSFTASIAYENFEVKMTSTDVTLSHVMSVSATGYKEGELYLGEAPVLGNGVISGMVEFKLYFNISGEVSLKAEQKIGSTNTWTPETGMQTSTTRDPGHVGSLNLNGTIEGGLVASPVLKLGYGNGGVDLLWIDVKGGIYAVSEYSTLAPYCSDVSWGVFATIDYGVGWRSDKMTFTFFAGRVYETRHMVQRWHIEGPEHIVQDECTYEGVCTIYFVTNGTAIDPRTCAAGAPIGTIDPPVRTGYVFQGWYTDPALTELFDMTSNLPQGALVLYAKWEGDSATYAPSLPVVTPPPTGGEDDDGSETPAVTPVPTPTRPSDWEDSYNRFGTEETEAPTDRESITITADCYEYTLDEDGYATITAILPYTFYPDKNPYPIVYEYAKPYDLNVPARIDNSNKRRVVRSVLSEPDEDGRQEWLYYVMYFDDSVPVETYPVKAINLFSSMHTNNNVSSLVTPPGLESVHIVSPYLKSATIGSGTSEVVISNAYYLESLTLHNVDEVHLYDTINLKSLTITNDEGHMTEVYYSNDGYVPNIRTLSLERCILNDDFNYCSELQEVTLKDCTVYNSFSYCEKLTTVNITAGDGSGYELEYAFNDCPMLSDITLPRGVVLTRSFSGCSGEKPVSIAVNSIDDWSFDATPLHVTAAEGPYSGYGFAGRSNLLSFRVDRTDEITLSANAFADCFSLRYCELPGTWKEGSGDIDYPDFLFHGCHDVELVVGVNSDTIMDYLNEYLYNSSTTDSADVFSSIRIDPGVEHIGTAAFYKMSVVRGDAALPSGLKTIGQHAFRECQNLTSVAIPSGVEEVGSYAFYNCDSLTDATLNPADAEYGSSVFYHCDKLENVSVNRVCETLGSYMFSFCPSIRSVHIPAAAASWARSVYSQCTGIEEVTFDAGLKVIPESLFNGCRGLTEIQLPSGLEEIGSNAFSLTGITELNIPSGVTKIGTSAFSSCYELAELELPDREMTYGDSVFMHCNSLTSIRIPGSIGTIPYKMFQHCSGLKTVEIGEGVTTVDEYAFYQCNLLKELKLPSTLTSIGYGAFANCSDLVNVDLPEGLTTLDNYAFRYCGCVSIDLPESLQTLGNGSLWMFNLTTVYVRNPMLTFKSDTFWWPSDEKGMTIFCDEESTIAAHVQDVVNEYDEYVVLKPLDKELYSITYLNGLNTSWASWHVDTVYDGMLLTRPEVPTREGYSFTGWYKDPECMTLWDFDTDKMPKENMVLYSGWEESATGAWDSYGDDLIYTGSNGGSTIIVPGSVGDMSIVAIGPKAFGDNTRTVHIPATIIFIDPAAFSGAPMLTEIVVDEANPFYYAVDGVLFNADGVLVKYPPNRAGESYVTPDDTTAIAENAFSDLKYLKSLTLSGGVKKLSARAIEAGDVLASLIFASDPENIATGAIVHLSRLNVRTPDEAPVVQAYLTANGADWNLATVVFSVNGAGVMTCTVKAGEPLPAGFVPDNSVYTTAEKLMPGWSPTASADDLWDFAADAIPADGLTLYAVFTDAYEYTAASGGVALTKYLGSATRVEIPRTVNGKSVVDISADCFGDPAGMTFLGESYDFIQAWVEAYGGTYEALECTLVFVTGSEDVVEPLTVPIGQTCTLPTPVRYGYTFSGWVRSDQKSTSGNQTLVDCRKIVLTASWTEGSSDTSGEALFNYELTPDGAVVTRYIHMTADAAPIPDTLGGQPVVGIADGAFSGCSIASVTIPATVTFIGDEAFAGCSYLAGVTLPDGLISLGQGAFSSCTSLREVTLPASLTSLPASAFAYCTGLTAMELPSAMTNVGERVFIGCSKLAALTVAPGNTAFAAADGVLYSTDGRTLLVYPAGKVGTAFSVPDGVTAIAAYAMSGTRIASLTLPASLTSIGPGAVSSCPGLTDIVFPETGSIAIGQEAFSGCMRLQNVTITTGVSSIAAGAFMGCSLKSVTLGSASPTIAEDAFPLTAEMLVYADEGSFGGNWANENGAIHVKPTDVVPTRIRISDVYMQVGSKQQLVPVFTPADATVTRVRWRVSDADREVVSIDENGVVTAWQAGTASVYGYLPGDIDYDTFEIIVYDSPADVQTVKLSNTEMTLRPNASKALTAELVPFGDDDILWSSTDETVAYYDEEQGEVVALKVGKAAITAYTESGVRASCLVEVTEANVNTNVGPIRLSVEYAQHEPSDSFSLTVTIDDDEHRYDEVYWQIDDEEVLEFNYHGGREAGFHARGLGTATIMAYTDCGYIAYCTIEVVEYVPRLTLSRDYIVIGAGWRNSGLYVTDRPDTATEITWSSDDANIAYYDPETGYVYGMNPGTVMLRATTDDGYTDECTVEVVIWGEMYLPSGLKEIEEEAFAGSNAFYIECNEGLETIGSRAFAGNYTLEQIYIPASVTSIAPDAFDECWNFYWVIGYSGTYAETWAEENGYGFSSLD